MSVCDSHVFQCSSYGEWSMWQECEKYSSLSRNKPLECCKCSALSKVQRLIYICCRSCTLKQSIPVSLNMLFSMASQMGANFWEHNCVVHSRYQKLVPLARMAGGTVQANQLLVTNLKALIETRNGQTSAMSPVDFASLARIENKKTTFLTNFLFKFFLYKILVNTHSSLL